MNVKTATFREADLVLVSAGNLQAPSPPLDMGDWVRLKGGTASMLVVDRTELDYVTVSWRENPGQARELVLATILLERTNL